MTTVTDDDTERARAVVSRYINESRSDGPPTLVPFIASALAQARAETRSRTLDEVNRTLAGELDMWEVGSAGRHAVLLTIARIEKLRSR